MAEKKQFKVLIIGGSVAGLSLANMLQLNGIDFVVLEGYPKIAPQVGASIGLLPNGNRILDQLGLFDTILELAPPVEKFNFRNSKGERIAGHSGMRHSFVQRHGYPILFLDRQMVLQVLYNNIKDKSKVLTEKRLEKIDLDENGVTATMADGSKFSGDFLAGCDGIHSTTRSEMWRLAESKVPGYFPPGEQNNVRCDYSCIFGISNPIEGLEPGNLHSVFREKTSYLINGGPKGRVYWFFFFKHPQTLHGSDIPRYTKEEEAKMFEDHKSDPITPEITFGDLLKKRITSTLTALPEYVYKKWSYDRIITLGDSAHKVHPIGGHGGNVAIEGAAALTNALVKALEKSPNSLTTQQLTTIFESVQKLREDRAQLLLDASHEQQRTEAMVDGLHKFVALTILPMTDTEDVMFNFSGNLPAAEKLDMVDLPPRAKLIPYKDELATAPSSRGIYGYLQILFYLACAAAGYYGMWIRPMKYGLSDAIDVVMDSGVFPYDSNAPLKQKFTGIGPLDSLLSVLSAVFTPGFAAYDKQFGTLALYFLGMIIQPLSIWLIEACRKRNDMNLLALPTIWLTLCQLLGAGVVMPFYYVAYTLFSNVESYWWPLSRLVPAHYVRVLLPAILIGYVIPTILAFMPWKDSTTVQNFGALWQFSPMFASLLTFLFSIIHKRVSPPKDSMTPFAAEQPKDLPYLKSIYLFAFLSGVALHFSVMSNILFSGNPELTLRSVFLFSESESLGDGLRNQFAADFWALNIATYGWCVNAVWDIKRVGRTTVDVGKAAIVLLLANVMVGPGAALVGCWYWREMAMARTSVPKN
ncbi:FAD binding domain-containing protein [Rutstroemia sp. NJR-2017a BBW]|nr:FAD binding domain-containing protein [Rutstroemia sp. NJR-2017a BBW]